MWIYDRQDSETETLTHLKTGVQVRRSASEICRSKTMFRQVRGRWIEDDSNQTTVLVNCDSTDDAKKCFSDITIKLKQKGDLVIPPPIKGRK